MPQLPPPSPRDQPERPLLDPTDPRAISLLDPYAPIPNPTDLLPGESEVETQPDAYYGRVEAGPMPLAYLSLGPRVDLDQVEDDVEARRVFLTGDMQTRVEVLTGKRLQQVALSDDERTRGRAAAQAWTERRVRREEERKAETERVATERIRLERGRGPGGPHMPPGKPASSSFGLSAAAEHDHEHETEARTLHAREQAHKR